MLLVHCYGQFEFHEFWLNVLKLSFITGLADNGLAISSVWHHLLLLFSFLYFVDHFMSNML